MFSLITIDRPDITDRHWQDFFDLCRAMKEKYKTGMSSTSWQELKKRHLSFLEAEEKSGCSMIFEDDKTVGWAEFYVRNIDTPQEQATVTLDAFFDRIPEGLSVAVAREFLDWMDHHGYPELFYMSLDRRTSDVGDRWNGEKLSKFDEFVLYREKADRALLQKWLKEIPQQNKGLKLEFYDEAPEKYIEQYAQLLTEAFHDMPEETESGMSFNADAEQARRYNRWRRENRNPAYHYFLVDQKNQLVAFTIADVNLNNPESMFQAMTGVTGRYRGRSLAKWLKAAMFFKLCEMFPSGKSIRTWMRAVNEPIQHINARMGYVLGREGREFKIKRAHLEDYLNNS